MRRLEIGSTNGKAFPQGNQMAIAAQTFEPQPMSWETFTASPYWKGLSPARQVWVTVYVSNGGDALAATKAAYPEAKEKSVRCMSYELRKTPEIVDALEFYRGGVTREVLLAECRAQLRRAEPGSVSAQRLLSQLERLVLGIKPGPRGVDEDTEPEVAPGKKVGDIIYQGATKLRVTEVSATGKVLNAEEEV